MLQQAEVTTGTSAEYKDLLSELLTVESFLRDYQVCLCVSVSACLPRCPCVPPFVSLCVCLCHCVSVHVSPPASLCVCLSVNVCQCVCL